MNFNKEQTLALGLFLLNLFVLIDLSQVVGTFLVAVTLGYLILSFRNEGIKFFGNNINWSLVFVAGGLLFIVWLESSAVLANYIFQTKFAVFDYVSLFQTIRSSTNIPVNTPDQNLILGIWGILIPIVETLGLVGMSLYFYARRVFKVPIIWQQNNPKMYYISALVGATAALYHLAVRQSSEVALLADFIFFSLSALLVFKFGRLIEAGFLHIYINTAVLLVGH